VNLDKYIVVSGAPGVHKLVSSRANGVIIEDRKERRTRFVPARQQHLTAIGTVAIYTYTSEGEGTVPLTEVFQKMLDAYEATPTPAPDANSTDFRDYFTTVLPDHDRDRVHINDIKKCVKWFTFMRDHGIFEEAQREAAAEAAAKEGEEKSEAQG
jgi:hypothetical protein